MHIGGMFERSANKLGPLVCRESYEQLKLLHLGEADTGGMTFSAAQMDPERIQMGENMKNICILGAGSLAFFFGFFLTYPFWRDPMRFFQPQTTRSLSREGSAFRAALSERSARGAEKRRGLQRLELGGGLDRQGLSSL